MQARPFCKFFLRDPEKRSFTLNCCGENSSQINRRHECCGNSGDRRFLIPCGLIINPNCHAPFICLLRFFRSEVLEKFPEKKMFPFAGALTDAGALLFSASPLP
jgi:hypothetical protein